MPREMNPLVCFLPLVLCLGIDMSNAFAAHSRSRTAEKGKSFSIVNMADNEAHVHCPSGEESFKKILKLGERIHWGYWKISRAKNASMICHVVLGKEDHVCGFLLPACVQNPCMKECKWRILDDEGMQVELIHGMWQTVKLEPGKESARNSGGGYSCGEKGKQKSRRSDDDSCDGGDKISAPPHPTEPKHGEPENGNGHNSNDGGSSQEPNRRDKNPKLAPSPMKPKSQQPEKCKYSSCENNAEPQSPDRGKHKAPGPDAELAPSPTRQASKQPQICECTCDKNAEPEPPAPSKGRPKSRKPRVSPAPSPVNQQPSCGGTSRDKNVEPPAPTKAKQNPGKPGPELLPAPTKQKPKQDNNNDGHSSFI